MKGPYHITIRLGAPDLNTPAEAPLAGEPFWDNLKSTLYIASAADDVVKFPPVNSESGLAPGFDVPDEAYSLKARYTIGAPWGTAATPAIVNWNDPDTGIYFPKDLNNAPLGVGVSFGGVVRAIFGSAEADIKTKIVGRAGSKVYGVSEADDFVLAAINKALDLNNDVVSVYVYETRLDADNGGWRERTASSSWYQEASSTTRGVRKKFPSTALIVARASMLEIYDADDVNLGLWMSFSYGASRWLRSAPLAVSAHNGAIQVASADGLMLFDLINDEGYFFTDQFRYRYSTPVSRRNDTTTAAINVGFINNQASVDISLFSEVSKVVAGVSSPTYVDPMSGLSRGYIVGVGTEHGYVVTPSRTVLTVGQDTAFTDCALSKYGDVFFAGADAIKVYRSQVLYGGGPGAPNVDEDGFIAPSYEYKSKAASVMEMSFPVYSNGSHPILVAAGGSMFATAWKNSSSALVLGRVLENKADPDRGMYSLQGADWTSGWMVGDCKGAWLANNRTLDRSGRGTSLTHNGTVPENQIATNAKIKAYGPFSTSNYFSAVYGANTISLPAANWSIPFWAQIPATTTGQVLFEIASSDSNEDYLRVEIAEVTTTTDPDNLAGSAKTCLVLTHRSNGNVITMTSYQAVDTGDWSLFVVAKRGNRLVVAYDGVFIMSYDFTATLAESYRGVQNASASLYIGRGVRAPAAPFEGKIALFRWCWAPATNNQIETMMDWETALFLNTASTDEFHFGAAVEEIRGVDIDPITGSLVMATDHGVYQYEKFIMSGNYLSSNSNLPNNDVNDVSMRAGNIVAGTASGTWVSFPAISVREKISTALQNFVPNEGNYVTNAGGSYAEYLAGTNTVTETIAAVIENPVGGGGVDVVVVITPMPVEIDPNPDPVITIPPEGHVCQATYTTTPTTIPNSNYNTLDGANWAGYVNYYDDLRAEWAKPQIQALAMFRTSLLGGVILTQPDIRKYGKWHYEHYVIDGVHNENRVVPPFPGTSVTTVSHDCVGNEAVNVRLEPIADSNFSAVVVEHPASDNFYVNTNILPNLNIALTGFVGGMLDYRSANSD